MTTETNGSAPLDGKRAAVLYTALELAIGDVEQTIERNTKAAAPYRGAMLIQLAAYKAERARLADEFPVLNGEQANGAA